MVVTEVYIFFLCLDPTEQTLKPHYPRGGARDAVRLCSNRITVDMIFYLRQLQEKYIEQGRPLYIVFLDFIKAFDTVGRTGQWQLLRKYGCPEKFTTMIESLHTGMMVNVRNGGEVSDTFAITNGVKQGLLTGYHAFLYISVSNA